MAKLHYKHKTISRFTVGPYNFVNHILEIDDSQLEDFQREHAGLTGGDRVNIVEVLNIENERPVGAHGSIAVRGPASTLTHKDAGAKSVADEAREAELVSRELAIATRERRVAEWEATLGPAPAANTHATAVILAGVQEVDLADPAPEVAADPATPTVDQAPAIEPAPAPLKLGGGLRLGGN